MDDFAKCRAASSGGGAAKKTLLGIVLLALPAVAAGMDGGIIAAIRDGGRVALAAEQASGEAAGQLTPQAAASGGEMAKQAMQTCAAMNAEIAASGGENRGALAKAMGEITASAAQLPVVLERIALVDPPPRQAHYKEMLLRYFGRNCAAIAELFRGVRAAGR